VIFYLVEQTVQFRDKRSSLRKARIRIRTRVRRSRERNQKRGENSES
jgi:hypothetical protein